MANNRIKTDAGKRGGASRHVVIGGVAYAERWAYQ